MRFIRGYYQYNQEDCGAACLATILNYYGRKTSISILKNKMLYDKNGANVLSIIETARKYGIDSEAYEGNLEELKEELAQGNFDLPLILHLEKIGIGGHYVVLKRIKNKKIFIFDPKEGHISLSESVFLEQWTGIIICFKDKMIGTNQYSEEILNCKYRYLHIIFKNKKILFISICLSIIISLISIIGALAYKVIIDDFIISDLSSNIITDMKIQYGMFFILLLSFYCLQSVILGIRDILIGKITQNLSDELAKAFFTHFLNISEKDLYYLETGDIVSRFQSIVQIEETLIRIIFTISTELVGLIIGTSILLKMSKRLFSYVIIMLLVYIFVIILGLPFLKKNRKKYYSSYSESMTELNQIINGRSVIVMQNRVFWFFYKALKKVKESNNSLYNLSRTEAIMTGLVILTESVGSLLVLWQGTLMVINGTLSLGSLIVFQSMLSYFTGPVQKLVLIQNEYQNLSILIQRLNDIFVIEPEKNAIEVTHEKNENYNLKLINIEFAYQYLNNVFSNVCLDIPMGSKIGMIGKSGSGKTTLIKIIASLYKPQDGKIYLQDKEYKDLPLSYVREKIAYVPQEPFIFQGTIIDNLVMGEYMNQEKERLILEISDVFGLYEMVGNEKNGLNLFVQENGNNLSGGQKQKIGLARALVKEPKILLLDEAISNIDKNSRKEILDYIYSNKKLTIISISHDESLYEYSNYLWIFDNNTVECKKNLSKSKS